MTIVNGFRLVSNSEIQTFKQCRRKWWLQWLRGLAPVEVEVQGVRNTGTRLHVALAEHYVPGKPGNAKAALQKAQMEDQIVAVQRSDVDLHKLKSDFDLENAMLSGYLEWIAETGADSQLEVIASEQYIEAEIPDVYGDADTPPVKAIGKVDTRVRDTVTGSEKFLDHKSVGTFIIPMLKQNQQLLHYTYLLSLQSGTTVTDGAYYNMLKRSKRTAKATPPFYARLEVVFNRYQIDTYRQHLVGTVTDMQNAERQLREDPSMHQMIAYPTPSRDCSWKCPFVKQCGLFDDGSRIEDALSKHFKPINPLDYYQGKEVEE